MKTPVAIALAISMTASWAALGGRPTAFGANASGAQSESRSTGPARYTDLQTTLGSGTVVHEYVDSAGTVFAISWSGPYLPDLKQLLGKHFGTFTAQGAPGRQHRGERKMERSDVVIVSGGHMGAFEGRAWLPAQLPAGFDPKGIQ